MTGDLAALRELLEAAVVRLAALEARPVPTAAERRRDALRAAVAAVDPAGTCSAWQAACRIEQALRGFDRAGLIRSGQRAPRDAVEVALAALHREELTGSARTLYRALTTLSDEDR